MRGMRSFVLVVALGLAVVPAVAFADWTDNFDSYATGSGLHGQGGWHGWDGNPAANAYVTDAQAMSLPNSVEIAAASDMVHEYGEAAGSWIFTAWQYIPVGFSGTSYFLLLNTYNDGGPYNWSSQVSFNSTGGVVTNDADGSTLPMIMGQWVEIRVEIDLDLDTQTFYYGGQVLYTSSWTEGMSGGGAPYFGAVDLFANSASAIYYDDMSLLPGGSTPVRSMTWGQVKGTFR
jgi:hypothetical protein